jgi:RHS repeat-associated protein
MLKQLNYGNGLQLTLGYNANRQQPITMKVGPNGTGTILDYSYEYYDAQGHNNNRIRSITDATDSAYSVNYTYDQWNRLTHAAAGAYARYYTYDAFGNLKTVTGSGGPQPNYTLNYAQNATTAPATNRILSVTENGATQGFTYDNAGNLTSGDGMTYAYDAANRLKEVNAGALGQYGYDGDGARVKKVEGGLTTHYVRSNKFGRVAFEVGQASLQRVYVYSGSGKLLAEQAPDGQIYWLHTSHLNSTRAMTDSSGNLSYKGQFDPHGQMLMEWSATGNPNLNTLKFTGYERDVATGLDYAEARTYKGNRGRFVQADPKGMEAASQSQPESLNRYSYVHNDPVNYVDPGGTDAIIWECVLLRKWFDGSNGQEIWWGLFSCTSYRELSARDPYGKSGGGGEQGGRGGGASNTDNGTKEEKRQRAINKAFEALYNRPECNDLISGRSGVASALLSVLSDRGQFTEQDDPLFHNSRSANVPALTQGQGDLAKIKLRPPIDDSDSTGFSSTGFFERDRYGIPGIPGGLDADTQRAFIFIHELSHATGRFTHPGQGDPRDFDEPPIPNEDLNKLIWETCFK